ncbi:hypothetical protein C900_03284 [Fulvivirga imtechensis AK7]|uniref:Uncharacterized protein n=1 Tax=Fulvivirga imtechensis AK7 TaxID=1237149 RepID=L8JTL1_9BACT|nr:hypothetical protein C900_03284 [Fulvivirga imtechensis AK7]
MCQGLACTNAPFELMDKKNYFAIQPFELVKALTYIKNTK